MENISIKSIRMGHANNSSSSHSLVFLGDKKIEDNIYDNEGFGWQYFTASSRKTKELYLLRTLFYNLEGVTHLHKKRILIEKNENTLLQQNSTYYEPRYHDVDKLLSKKYCCRIIKSNFSDIFLENNLNELLNRILNDNDDYEYSIDHQSIINLPVNKYQELDYIFIKKLFSIILDNNFAILGGNDNSVDNHPNLEHHINNKFSDNISNILKLIGVESSSYNTVIHYDELNDDYILQYKDSANKFRFSFNVDSKPTTKSGFPELIDIRITNWCDYGCKFCYMSSTKEGKHGKIEDIKKIVDMLYNSNVMEIAIGGGEPTSHPEFVEILKYIKNKNMMVGFTTKNWELHQHKDFKYIIKYANSIAFSCQSTKEIEKVLHIQEEQKNITNNSYSYGPEYYIQTILELSSLENLEKMFVMCAEKWLPITLLGYKNFGFGKTYKIKNLEISETWIDIIKKFKGLEVGIDSIIVSKWREKLIEKGCDAKMLIGEEGKFSCYIEADTLKIAKSSFNTESEELDLTKENILEYFQKY